MTRKLQFLLTDAIEHHARFSAGDIAVVCDDKRLTWGAFELQTRKLANALIDAGLQKGDRVCMFMTNSLTAYVAMWGIIRAGGVVSALNTQLSGTALAGTINDAEPRFVFADAVLAETLWGVWDRVRVLGREHIYLHDGEPSLWALIADGDDRPIDVAIDEDDSISIVYSSGSTGKPKGIEHSHGARKSFTVALGATLGIIDRHAVTLISTPLCTNGTWITLAPTVWRGGKVVLTAKFSPQLFCDLVEAEGCTHAFGVPTQYIGLIGMEGVAHRDLSSLRGLLCAGQPLLSATYESLITLLPDVRVYEAYGMSEGFGTIATPEDFARGKRGTVGKPWFLDDIAILGPDGQVLGRNETGEIAGWSAGMMKGYYRDPERTAADTWDDGKGRKLLKSGDLGYLDDDGYLFINGRVKDMIKSGGLNIFSADLEAVFIEHPAVQEVAVIGIPHDKWGETPHLVAILRPGASVEADELLDWGNAKLSKFQRVASAEFREDFPRALYGKANKIAMREAFWAGRERSN
jgi:Acyl-CoA synthetases (AMP-forming)/AMP-acid ligases II